MSVFDTTGLKSNIRRDALTKVKDQNAKLAQHLQVTWRDKKIHVIERLERASPNQSKKGWRIWYED